VPRSAERGGTSRARETDGVEESDEPNRSSRRVIAAAVGALALGLSLGFLGSGGSILAVPILVYLLGQPPKEAIAGSLAVVGIVALVGAIDAARRRAVAWRAVLLFGVAGVVGSAGGALLGSRSRGAVQLAAFGVVLLAAAGAMALRRPLAVPAEGEHHRSAPEMLLDGLIVGGLTGYLGVGGGFLIVPALVLLAGLPMSLATGTSLVIIALNCATGFATQLVLHPEYGGALDLPTLGSIAAVGAVGSLAGRHLAGLFDDRMLRRLFAAALVLLALYVLRQALPEALACPLR